MAKRQKDRQHNGQKTEGQTTQWPKQKVQQKLKNKQRSTKHTHNTNWVYILSMNGTLDKHNTAHNRDIYCKIIINRVVLIFADFCGPLKPRK